MSKKNGRRAHRNTLAVCIIARDEEELLPVCLDSLADENGPIYDELAVGVDSRTTDNTRQIAASYGAKVLELQWPENDEERDFASARNAVEDATTADYLYWQDADEVLVAGHESIRRIVRDGMELSARPMIMNFDNTGLNYPRQDLLHRRTSHRWHGRFHEWTEGPPGPVHAEIQVEQRQRAGGDRPHGDSIRMLFANFEEATTAWHERHLFYVLREFAGRHGVGERGYWATAIAMAEKLLQHKAEATGSPFQTSHACLIAGELCGRLDDPDEERRWYLKAIEHWAAWAEPHYALGVLCYQVALQHLKNNETAPKGQRIGDDIIRVLLLEACGWLTAATRFEPPAYYHDANLYRWRRYESLAVVLARLGRLEEAHLWLARALAAEPGNESLQRELAQLEAAMEKEAVPA